MKLYSNKWFFQRIIYILFTLLFVSPVVAHPDDEMDFFNVGQGHAVLIRKGGINETTGQPYAPLLIDAGATAHPFKVGERYEWIKDDVTSLSSQIANHILRFWKESHGHQLRGGRFNLNIIVTHPDKDHQEFIPSILAKLRQESEVVRTPFTFDTSLLLGGTKDLYPEVFWNYPSLYSNDCKDLFVRGGLSFLESSGCITHLFCPKGIKSDKNRWSIVTRVQLDNISAIFTGDADSKVKKSMLTYLSHAQKPATELQSDILHVPHHGADGTFLKEWDEAVNPRAIVIGSGLHDTCKHPQGTTIREYLYLLNARGRLWEDKVMPHALQYHCGETIHREIGQTVETKGRVFDVVPLLPEVESEEGAHWRLVWTDAPVYTLWTTGTLVFKGDVRTPNFRDAPSGISSYIAIPDPLYLFDPILRRKLTPLSEEERRIYAIILDLVRKKFGGESSYDKERALLFINLAVKEFHLISDHVDRDLYLYTLRRVFEELKPVVWRNMSSFQWLREAVVERNRHVPENEERLKSAVNFLFRNIQTLIQDGDSTLGIEICDGAFERNTFVLKTFLKSHHPLKHLKKYVTTSFSSGFSPEEMEVLCPFGFPEWLQLEKLASFVGKEIIQPSGEPISLGDVFDIFSLRLQGKNFKEISRAIVESEGFIQETQREAIDKLKEFVKSLRATIKTSAEGRMSVDCIVDMQSQRKSFREIRQTIVQSESFHEDLQHFNEICRVRSLSHGFPHAPLTLENFVSFDDHPTTLEEFYQKLEEYFPRAIEEYLT